MQTDLRFVVERDPRVLAAHRDAWEDLSAHAIEPNPFYEPFMLLPAVDVLAAGVSLHFVFIYAAHVLLAVLPMERATRYKGLPLAHLRSWTHRHCYLGTPLVRRGQAERCVEGFLDWLPQSGVGVAVQWNNVPADGAFSRLLIDRLERRRRKYVAYQWRRALLARRNDWNSVLTEALSKKARHEARRLERRLAELGRLEYRAMAPHDDPGPWIDQFLELESQGWKGRRGSALACRNADRAFFIAWAQEAARRGRLMMLALNVAGRSVAMKCNIVAGQGSYAFKIAYDEAYARYSPGLLLEIDNIRRLHADSTLQWMDSCADPNNFMMNHVWPARRAMLKLVMPAASVAGPLFVGSLPWVRQLKHVMMTGRA